MLSPRNFLRIILNSLLGLILVILWLHFVNLNQITARLEQTNFGFLSLFLVGFVLGAILRSLRLKFLLRKYSLKLTKLIGLTFLSQFLSFAIPIRAGEIAKSVYLSGAVKQALPKTILWIFIDRFLDFWVYILICLILVFSLATTLPEILSRGLILACLGFSLAAILMITSQKWAKVLVNLFLPKFARGVILSIIDQFSLLRVPIWDFSWLILLTIGAILADSLVLMSVILALGISLEPLKVIFANALMALTFLIPAAPGYVGSAEASGLIVLTGVIGLDKDSASTVAVLQHLIFLIILPIFGIISLYFLKFNLKLVWEKLRN